MSTKKKKHGTIMREMPAENNAKKNTREQNESHKIYASLACIYYNVESHRSNFGDCSQLANWILY